MWIRTGGHWLTACLNSCAASYSIDPHGITVAGISAGAYMVCDIWLMPSSFWCHHLSPRPPRNQAVQLHVAFSSLFSGAAISAGGPFYCCVPARRVFLLERDVSECGDCAGAQAQVGLATTACMKDPGLISVTELVGVTQTTALSGFIDPLVNLADDRVYLYSGTKDTVVHPGVVKKLEEFYLHFLSNPGDRLETDYDVPSEHAWITDFFGNACDVLGVPYINNCQYDMAAKMLQHLYNNTLSNPTAPYGGLPQNVAHWVPPVCLPFTASIPPCFPSC